MKRREKYSRYQAKRSVNHDNLRVIQTSPAPPPPPVKPIEQFYRPRPVRFPKDYKQNSRDRKKQQRIDRNDRRRNHLTEMQMEMENRSYHWYNPNYMINVVPFQNVYQPRKRGKRRNPLPFRKSVKTIEKDTGGPAEEGYFEEVEAVTFETEIPVVFRKSKIHYLKYKRNGFFRPKIYSFGEPCTVVTRVSAQNNIPDDADIDVISEAEYDADVEADKLNKAESSENLIEVVDLEEEDCNADANISPPSDKVLSEEKPQKSDETESSDKQIEVIDLLDDSQDNICKSEKKISPAETRIKLYKTCIEDTSDLCQGKSLNQNSFDSWKSHLIGLQYLIEIQNNSKDSVLKCHCVLCGEDLAVEGFPAVTVIHHVSTYKHIVKYLERHFPSCGYRFAENSDYDNNFVILQKLCEEINKKAGYFYMCITNIDAYERSKQVMQELILNATHASEDSVNVDYSLLEKTLETNILSEVSDALNGIIFKICPNEAVDKNSKGMAKKVPDKELLAKNKDLVKKRSSAVSSYLKLKFASSKPKNQKPSTEKPTASDIKEKHSVEKSNTVSSDQKLKDTGSKLERLPKEKPSSKPERLPKDKPVSKPEIPPKNKPSSKSEVPPKEKSAASGLTEKPPVGKRSSAVSSYLKLKFANSKLSKSPKPKPTVSELKEKDSVGKAVKDSSSNSENVATNTASRTSKTSPKVVKAVSKPEPKVVKSVEIKAASKPVLKVTKPVVHQKMILKRKEMTVSTSAMHSKHCRKRILGKAISTLRVAAKTSSKGEQSVNTSLNESVKHQSVEETVHPSSASKGIVHIKKKIAKKEELKQGFSKTHGNSSYKLKSPLRKITPIQKATAVGAKSPVEAHSKSHPVVNYKGEEVVSDSEIAVMIEKEIARLAPYKKHSRSPHKRTVRRYSKSPVRPVIKSPIRVSPWRKHSRSPVRRHKRSPIRKHSRSPIKRHSRSPIRRHSRSPKRKHVRSPIRRHSRSPIRKHSRSPVRKRSRSPVRRRSRSPIRRYSRSPRRRVSRSPVRRRSRSPVRRRTRSPIRRHSRSPISRHSRSPLRRHSRSPNRRYSRSPVRKLSPIRRISSSYGRSSRSPIKHRSRSTARSPLKEHSRSPHSNLLSQYRDLYRSRSPSFEHSRIIEDHLDSLGRFSSSKKSMYSSSNRNRSLSYSLTAGTSRDTDLDPVSDEDESVYFNTSDKLGDGKASDSMIEKLLQKFISMEPNPNNASMNKFMHFIKAHSAEIREMEGSEYDFKSSKTNSATVDSNVEERNLLLKQYLLSNLPGNVQPMIPKAQFSPSASNVPPSFIPPPFVPNHPPPSFGPAPHMPTQDHLQPAINQQNIFPPNLHMPPPEPFHQPNQPPQGLPPRPRVPPPQQFHQPNQLHQGLPPKPKVPPEVMFKDLKATVHKLFGASESLRLKEKHKLNVPPGFVTQPDPEKWDLNHPNAPKFSGSPGSKNVFPSQEKNMGHAIPGICEQDDMSMSFNSGPGFFSNRGNIDRARLPIPPPNAKVSFCDAPSQSSKGNLFPVINSNAQGSSNMNSQSVRGSVNDVKVSLAQRLASVLVKVGMIDVPAPLLQEMLMKIGAFSSSPPQDITEAEIVSILKRLGYL